MVGKPSSSGRTPGGLEEPHTNQRHLRHQPKSPASHHHYQHNHSAAGKYHGGPKQKQPAPPRPLPAGHGREVHLKTTGAPFTSTPLLSAGPGSWAHMLAHPEQGCLLLSKGGPDMAFFDRTVILVTSHGEDGRL